MNMYKESQEGDSMDLSPVLCMQESSLSGLRYESACFRLTYGRKEGMQATIIPV